MNKLIPALVVIAVAGVAAYFLLFSTEEAQEVSSYVETGSHVVKVRAPGRVDTLKATSIRAPDCRFSRQIVWLKEEGSHVKKGELVAKFDASDVALYIEQLNLRTQALLEEKINNALMWDITIERIENSISLQIETVSLQELDYDQKKYHATLVRKMSAVGVNNQQGILQSLHAQKERLLQQRKMSEQYADEKMQRHLKALKETEDYIKLYDIYAPFDSIIHYPEIHIAGIYKKAEAGDSLVQLQDFARLPDFSVKSLLLQVKERDIKNLKAGLKVKFHSKTYPEIMFEGKVRSVSNVPSEEVQEESRQFFDVVVEMEQTQENMALLLPGMTVSADIIISTMNDVYAIPADYVATRADENYITAQEGDSRREILLEGAIFDSDFAVIEAAKLGGKRLKIYGGRE